MSLFSVLAEKITGIHTAQSGFLSTSNIIALALVIYLIASGVLCLRGILPRGFSFDGYTEDSVRRAAPIMGIGNILLGLLLAVVGVVSMDAVPHLFIYLSAGALLAASVAVLTLFYSRLRKIPQ